jgi:hypothetical protein
MWQKMVARRTSCWILNQATGSYVALVRSSIHCVNIKVDLDKGRHTPPSPLPQLIISNL